MRRPLVLMLTAFGFWSTGYAFAVQWLPVVAVHRGATPAGAGAILAAGYLGAAGLGLPASLLADRFGLRRALLAAWAVASLGALWLALAPGWTQMLPAALLFMSGSGLLPVLGALTARHSAPGEEQRGFAWLFAGGPLGLLAGSLLGGWAAMRWQPAAPIWLAAAAQVLALAAATALPADPAGAARGARGPAAVGPDPIVPARVPTPHPKSPALLWLMLAAAAGYGLLMMPGTLTALWADRQLAIRLDTNGLLHAILAAAQLGWHLLLTRLLVRSKPEAPAAVFGPLRLSRSTVLVLTVIFLTTGAGCLLLALVPTAPALTISMALRGSLFSLQPLASAVLSQGERRGRSGPLAVAALASGVSTAAAGVAGGWLYQIHAAVPFVVAGSAAMAAAVLLTAMLALLPPARTEVPAQ